MTTTDISTGCSDWELLKQIINNSPQVQKIAGVKEVRRYEEIEQLKLAVLRELCDRVKELAEFVPIAGHQPRIVERRIRRFLSCLISKRDGPYRQEERTVEGYPFKARLQSGGAIVRPSTEHVQIAAFALRMSEKELREKSMCELLQLIDRLVAEDKLELPLDFKVPACFPTARDFIQFVLRSLLKCKSRRRSR